MQDENYHYPTSVTKELSVLNFQAIVRLLQHKPSKILKELINCSLQMTDEIVTDIGGLSMILITKTVQPD